MALIKDTKLTIALKSIEALNESEKKFLYSLLSIQPLTEQTTPTKKQLEKLKFRKDVENYKKGLYIFFKQGFKNRTNNTQQIGNHLLNRATA